VNQSLQSKVLRALEAQGDSQLIAIGSLCTAEQLHHFVLNYNINDGVAPAFTVLANPYCDAGTALYMYWLCWPGFDGQASAPRRGNPAFDFEALRDEISRRLDGNSFVSARIFFDPAAGFSQVQLYKLTKEGAKHLEPVGVDGVDRLWL
jgi:hypothetical protein